ncbi:alpha/beta fold hydrolase [Nocardia sp. KC 131]|uniref:alpha/beta fold hydrolase n=1 Tax=Nocardia arseniciresistens TaxID=3392119 RepID=UPI00398EC224
MPGGQEHPGEFVVTLPDGHRLQCRVEGPEDGTPIFQLHGVPGSRVDTAPPELLDRVGVRLITYDRPGYSGSDPQQGLRVADVAKHVEAIADRLGIDEFAVVGRSGGTPYAAAVAAELPGRLTRLGLLVPIASPALMKNEFYAGMTRQAPGLAESFETVTAQKFANFTASPTDPMGIIGIPWDRLGSVDREIVAKHPENLCNSYAEGLRNGYGGWVEDLETYRRDRPWGLEIGDIECPTTVWTASGDGFTPSAHAETIAGQLSSGQGRLYMVPGEEVGHFGAQEIKPGVYAWLAGREDLTLFPTDLPPNHPPGVPVRTALEHWTNLADPSAG